MNKLYIILLITLTLVISIPEIAFPQYGARVDVQVYKFYSNYEGGESWDNDADVSYLFRWKASDKSIDNSTVNGVTPKCFRKETNETYITSGTLNNALPSTFTSYINDLRSAGVPQLRVSLESWEEDRTADCQYNGGDDDHAGPSPGDPYSLKNKTPGVWYEPPEVYTFIGSTEMGGVYYKVRWIPDKLKFIGFQRFYMNGYGNSVSTNIEPLSTASAGDSKLRIHVDDYIIANDLTDNNNVEYEWQVNFDGELNRDCDAERTNCESACKTCDPSDPPVLYDRCQNRRNSCISNCSNSYNQCLQDYNFEPLGTSSANSYDVEGNSLSSWIDGYDTREIRFRVRKKYPGGLNSQWLVINPITLLAAPPTENDGLSISPKNPKCHDGSDGKIVVDVSEVPDKFFPFKMSAIGDNDGLEFNSSTDGTKIFTGLSAGNYILYTTKMSEDGDTALASAAISESVPNGPEIEVNLSGQNVVCKGENNGKIRVGINPLQGEFVKYNILINNTLVGSNIPKSNFENNGKYEISRGAGEYIVEVKGIYPDNTKCAATNYSPSNQITINDPSVALEISNVQLSQPTCNGGNDGEITITTSGGWGNYEYSSKNSTSSWSSWHDGNSNNNNNKTYSGLEAGTYGFRIKDSGGCIVSTTSVNLGEPTAVSISISEETDPSCYGEPNGSIKLEINDAAGTLITYTLKNLDKNKEVAANATLPESKIIGGLYGDVNYRVFIKDENGCQSNDITFQLNNPQELAINSLNYTNPTCFGGGDGAITVSAAGGIPDNNGNHLYTLELKQGPTLKNSYSSVQNVTERSFDNLSSGGYSLIIYDEYASGCSKSFPLQLEERADPLHLESTEITLPTCYTDSDGTITIQGVEGDSPYQYSIDGINFTEPTSGSYTYTGLSGDRSYTFYVRDSNWEGSDPNLELCEISNSFYLPERPRLEVTDYTIENVLCNGGDDGAINIDPTGGQPPYQFTWTSDLNESYTTQNLENIPAGTYSLLIEDANGCVRPNAFTVTVNEPVSLQLQQMVTSDVTCEANADGTVTIVVVGGVFPYQYSLDNGLNFKSDPFFDNLIEGNYDLLVEDRNGCQVTGTFEIGTSEVIAEIVSLEDVNCFAGSDGMIFLEASGGRSPYQYSINGGDTFQDIPEFYDLGAGSYDVIVKDFNECESPLQSIQIAEPDELIANVTVQEDASCGLNNGVASVEVSGGAAPFDVKWYAQNGEPVDPQELSAGDYLVQVRDENGCQTENSFIINDLPGPVVTGEVTAIPYCGLHIGGARVNISEGFPPYSVFWDDDNNQTGEEALNLKAGTYHPKVIDSKGCQVEVETILEDGPEIKITEVEKTNATCGQADGEATISVSDGVEPYQFYWPSYAVVSNEGLTGSGLHAGIHEIQVVDAVSCSKSYIVTIDNEEGPQIDEIVITKSYCGLATGSVEAIASVGSEPYDYLWIAENGMEINNPMAENLVAGRYVVQVTDATGCIVTGEAVIEDDPEVVPELNIIQVQNAACGKPLGSAEVEMTGGLGPFAYIWSDPGNTTGPVAQNLAAGIYYVTAIDAKGCSQTIDIEIIDDPEPVLSIVSASPTYCGQAQGSAVVAVNYGQRPFTYVWEDYPEQDDSIAAGLVNGYVSVKAVDSNGCETNSVEIYIDEINDLDVRIQDITNVSCKDGNDGSIEVKVIAHQAPFTITWDDPGNQSGLKAENLIAGEYTVTVEDSVGCSISKSIEVGETEPLRFLTIAPVNPRCYGQCNGEIFVSVQGGTAPFSYHWDNGKTGNKISELCAGTYSLTVTDANNCLLTETIVLEDPEQISETSLPESKVICEGNSITLDPGRWRSYSWIGPHGFESSEREVNVHIPGSYFLTVTTNAGCIVKDTFRLEVSNDLLNANVLIASEVYAWDTVEIIDISYPPPDQIFWTIPEEAELISERNDRIEVLFRDEGLYFIEMEAHSGKCEDTGKFPIEILSRGKGDGSATSRLGYKKLIKDFSLYPNPNQGNFEINIELTEPHKISLFLNDYVRSRVVKTLEREGSDQYKLSFNLNLTSGVYAAELRVGKEQKFIRLVVP